MSTESTITMQGLQIASGLSDAAVRHILRRAGIRRIPQEHDLGGRFRSSVWPIEALDAVKNRRKIGRPRKKSDDVEKNPPSG